MHGVVRKLDGSGEARPSRVFWLITTSTWKIAGVAFELTDASIIRCQIRTDAGTGDTVVFGLRVDKLNLMLALTGRLQLMT